MDRTTLDAILAAKQDRKRRVLTTHLGTGAQQLYGSEDVSGDGPEAEAVAAAMATGRSRIAETADGDLFVQAFLPPPRLIIVGATHIAQVLVEFARRLALDVSVVDPRGAFVTPERFADTALVEAWPDEAFERIGLDARSAVICLAHEAGIDDEALTAALAGGCFYVGALGSKRTHAKRVTRLAEAGMSDADIASIHAPIGLDIGALTPEEIALSIIAEVVQALRQPEETKR